MSWCTSWLPSWNTDTMAPVQSPSSVAADSDDAAGAAMPNIDFLSELSSMPGGVTSSRAPTATAVPCGAPKNATETPRCESDTPIIAVTIYARNDEKAFVLATAEDLGQFSWWYRSQVGEFVRFGCRQVAQHTAAGACQSVLPDEEHSALQFCCHGLCESKGRFVATMVTPCSTCDPGHDITMPGDCARLSPQVGVPLARSTPDKIPRPTRIIS